MKNDDIEIRIKQFLREIFTEEEIYEELDTEMSKKIYMPQSIKSLIEVPVVNRMNRILQNGSNIYGTISIMGTRMQHSKGTYELVLELLTNLWHEDEKFKQRVIENNQQKYIKAILVKELLHDIGHGAFSHTLETVCNLPRGTHEKIGNRLILENNELNDALNSIEQGLPNAMRELEEQDVLGMESLCEGQFDVDRADFLSRDNYFIGKDYKSSNVRNQELIHNIRMMEYADSNGNTVFIPVFEESQMNNIEDFLQNRYDNYIEYYQQNEKYMDEQIFKVFGMEVMKLLEESPLKKYLKSINGKDPNDIDLDEYTSFDDIKFLKEVIKIIKTTKDERVKKLGLMTLPPIEAVPGLYYGVMINSNKRTSVEEQLSESDEQFIRDMKDMEKLRKKMSKGGDFKSKNCLLLDTDREDEVTSFLKKIQDELMENGNQNKTLKGIQVWKNQVYFYKDKQKEEIYILAQDGKCYKYNKHPNRTKSAESKTKVGLCVIVPELEIEGYNATQINRIKEEVMAFNVMKEKEKTDIEDR